MKIKLLIPLIICSSLLTGCNTNKVKVKYVLEKKEVGSLTLITPKEMFDISSIEQKDSVFFLSLSGCSACAEAKTEIEYFVEMNKCEIYQVEFSDVTFSATYSNSEESYPDTDYYWLYKSTTYVDGDNGYYALPRPQDDKSDLYFPMLYFYKYGGVGYKTTTNIYDALKTRVEVK